MKLELRRYHQTADAIDGVLFANGTKLCYTAEHAETALKPGTYTICRHFCKQYQRCVPAILSGVIDTPERLAEWCEGCPKMETEAVNPHARLPYYCPQLKMGNGVHNRDDGSIIMGTPIVPGCLKDTVNAYRHLSERIRKATERHTMITLTIGLIEHAELRSGLGKEVQNVKCQASSDMTTLEPSDNELNMER